VNHPEQSLQKTIAAYLTACVALPPDGPYWTAVNPVPAKSKAAAGLSKAMGLREGTPDLIFLWRGEFIGVELKAGKGTPSTVQRNAHAEILLSNGVVFTVWSLDELIDVLQQFGIPVKGKVRGNNNAGMDGRRKGDAETTGDRIVADDP
jgi:hypothetical protein